MYIPNKLLAFSSSIMALCVILGAFGAHGLKAHLSEYQLGIYQTGIQYMFYHGLASYIPCLLLFRKNSKQLVWTYRLFMVGILFFSGSLFLLATRNLLNISSWTWLGPLTPIGGLCFVVGWINLVLFSLKLRSEVI